jgi:hypothetical protein
MNDMIIRLIKQLNDEVSRYMPSGIVRNQVTYLNFIIDEQHDQTEKCTIIEIQKEIEKILFDLIIKISNDRSVHLDIISTFSEIIIELIDKKSKQNEDITDLVMIFDKIKISVGSQ